MRAGDRSPDPIGGDRRRLVRRAFSGFPARAAAALIVEKKIVLFAEVKELWQKVAVVGAGAAVKDEQPRRAFLSISRPIERNIGRGGAPLLAWRRDRLRHQRAVKSVFTVTFRHVCAMSSAVRFRSSMLTSSFGECM